MNMTEYLTTEQDKWHRRYNDAEIEIDRLKRENEFYKLAIHRLIMERDMAIKDVNQLLGNECNRYFCANGEDCNTECRWRGVKYR